VCAVIIVWLTGLVLSCVLGYFIVEAFLKWLSTRLGLPPDRSVPGDFEKRTPVWVTGGLERFFFTIAVAVNIAGVLPAMIAWLAVKLAANWQTRVDTGGQRKNYAFSALLGGFLSMLIAFVCGLLIRLLSSSGTLLLP
jgi:hypothetical protein